MQNGACDHEAMSFLSIGVVSYEERRLERRSLQRPAKVAALRRGASFSTRMPAWSTGPPRTAPLGRTHHALASKESDLARSLQFGYGRNTPRYPGPSKILFRI